jgi:hypothetical protein
MDYADICILYNFVHALLDEEGHLDGQQACGARQNQSMFAQEK